VVGLTERGRFLLLEGVSSESLAQFEESGGGRAQAGGEIPNPLGHDESFASMTYRPGPNNPVSANACSQLGRMVLDATSVK
jgi:hypothetical protein